MDGSPLTSAQSHVIKASKANTPTAAIDEHELAAGQFSTAAKGVDHTSEAFRTLKLLEEHHQKIAQLIKFQNARPIPPSTEIAPEVKPSTPQAPAPSPPKPQDGSPYRPQSQSLLAAHRPPRDISSSIASNLASARGIPSNRQRRNGQASSPALAQPHVEGKIVSPPKRSRVANTPGKTANTVVTEKSPVPPSSTLQTPTPSTKASPLSHRSTPQAPTSDEPFQRFYTTFESLFTKLSAPLAFAGLPLSQEETPPPPAENPPIKPPPEPRERATAEPDYSRLFSKAALKAIHEEPGGNNLGAAESFYVVPTTGGTMPYASILARGGHAIPTLDRNGTRTSDDLEEFVDARETPGPPSPLMTRGGGGTKKAAPNTSNNKTMEELHLENSTLRHMLETVSRRLQDFEIGAQTSSLALHQSIRASLKHQSPAASASATVAVNGEVVERLEEQVREGKREVERVRRENERLKGVVERYRERWEKLKEGARVRREGTGVEGGVGEGGA